VVEFVFSGTRVAGDLMGMKAPEKAIGLVGAVVVDFDEQGLAKTQRIYLDVATLLGQVQPGLLPTGMKVRAAMTEVPAGVAVLESSGAPGEAKNLDATNAIWARLEAHAPAEVMALSSEDYVYEDFAAPGALRRAETQQMVAGFLAAVPDFKIAAKPVQIAAGDDVVTEMIERATFKGRPITLHGLDVKRFENGKVVKEWQYANGVEALTQMLGLKLPATAPGAR
jgi:hypothetical protein